MYYENYSYVARVDGRIMRFATEGEYIEYLEELEQED